MALELPVEESLDRPRTLRTIKAIAEAVFARQDGPAPAERIRWLCAEMDELLTCSGPGARTLLGAALLAVSAATPVFARRPVPLEKLSLPARIEALQRLEESFAAAPLLAVKAMLCLVYYEHPDAAREIGFDGSCHKARP